MMILTLQADILCEASDHGRLSMILYVSHFLIMAYKVDLFIPTCLPIIDLLSI